MLYYVLLYKSLYEAVQRSKHDGGEASKRSWIYIRIVMIVIATV